MFTWPKVYEQVTKLFNNAPDLLDEFKQFLPENGSGGLAGMGFGSFMQAAAGAPPLAPEKAPVQKRGSKDVKDTGAQKKRRGPGPSESKGSGSRVRHHLS
jgi:paired amphipathic helix protein Sin3a